MVYTPQGHSLPVSGVHPTGVQSSGKWCTPRIGTVCWYVVYAPYVHSLLISSVHPTGSHSAGKWCTLHQPQCTGMWCTSHRTQSAGMWCTLHRPLCTGTWCTPHRAQSAGMCCTPHWTIMRQLAPAGDGDAIRRMETGRRKGGTAVLQ